MRNVDLRLSSAEELDDIQQDRAKCKQKMICEHWETIKGERKYEARQRKRKEEMKGNGRSRGGWAVIACLWRDRTVLE